MLGRDRPAGADYAEYADRNGDAPRPAQAQGAS
jgi:hypothetical protein